MNFKELHHQSKPLLLFNVWDVASCKIAEELGFKAIGSSSSAIAQKLGYEDGENISFRELKFIVSRISASTHLPFSVDIEAGYGQNNEEITQNIIDLYEMGVEGINIEDSKLDVRRELIPSEEFSSRILQIKRSLEDKGINIFLNVRTDTYLMDLARPLEESIKRAQLYKEAGADGLFVPGMTKVKDIKTLIQATKLPLNVMCYPNLPNFDTLGEIGIKRISMGDFLFKAGQEKVKAMVESALIDNSFKSLLSC